MTFLGFVTLGKATVAMSAPCATMICAPNLDYKGTTVGHRSHSAHTDGASRDSGGS
jgi:hypothetical protein